MAFSAQGTLLKVGDGGSPENFIAIAELSDLSDVGWAASTIETTSHDSLRQTWIAGLELSDSFSFTGNWVPGDTAQDDIIDSIKTITPRNIEIEVPSSPAYKIAMSGYFVDFKVAFPTNDRATLTGTFQKDGLTETTHTTS